MSKRFHTKNSYTVLLVDATKEEVVQTRKRLPGWHWLEAPEDRPLDLEAELVDRSLDAIVVFAHKNKEARVLDVCKSIREQKDLESVPLLVAASRYQMALRYEMRRFGVGDFVFTPIDEAELTAKMDKATSVSP